MERRHPEVPSITVITATYNSAATVRDTLESVRSQVGVDIEHIIVDGASTDATLAIVAEYPHVATTLSEPDRGIYDALNKGLALATGDIVGFLHADDVYQDTTVLSDIAHTFATTSATVTYGDLVYVSRTKIDRILRYWIAGEFHPKKLRRGWMPPHPTLYVRKSTYRQVGNFNLSYSIAADYDHCIRLLRHSSVNVQRIDRILIRMRIGGASNRSARQILQKSIEDLRIMRAHRLGSVYPLLLKNLTKARQFITQRRRLVRAAFPRH